MSDFHLTGQIDQEFFRFAIQEVNAWEPDLIFLTGDLVDELHCLDWIEPVFGKLRSRFGSYYLLGNHDRRIPSEHNLRDRLERVGLVRAGGRWIDLDVNGQALSIAGNELPWYPGAESLSPRANHDALQILLTHSPDQIDWARPFGFDLIFAGHTHGGQIRLPVVGPIISPSKYWVRFAGGSFTVDRSVMHVSRGICGDEPIRILCPPEIGFFLLQSPESPTTQSSAVSSR
jgi:predicted MPP superfamily phosphohydrolase